MKPYLERRIHPRVACSFPASIEDERSSTECTVVDLSVSGARLKLPYEAPLNNGVMLRIPSKEFERRVELVWRAGGEAGVIFSMNILGRADAIVPQPKASAKPIPVVALREMALETRRGDEDGSPRAEEKSREIDFVRCMVTGVLTGVGAAANILFGFGRF